jgi:hypothetical protein
MEPSTQHFLTRWRAWNQGNAPVQRCPLVSESEMVTGEWVYNTRLDLYARFYDWFHDGFRVYFGPFRQKKNFIEKPEDQADWVVHEPKDAQSFWKEEDQVCNSETGRCGIYRGFNKDGNIVLVSTLKYGGEIIVSKDEYYQWRKKAFTPATPAPLLR